MFSNKFKGGGRGWGWRGAGDVHQLHEELLEMEVRLDQARRGRWEAQYQWEEAAARLRGVEAELAAERAGAERLQTDAAAPSTPPSRGSLSSRFARLVESDLG